MKFTSISGAVLVALGCVAISTAHAHGFAGKRFFPATLATDDPFVADELSLPTITWQKNPGDGPGSPATRETDVSMDAARRITSNFGLEAAATWKTLSTPGVSDVNGFDTFALGAKYQFFESDAHEAIASVGVDWDIGNSGAKRVGAESISTVTPALFFGKGLGDLPDAMSWLRPVAVTGLIGVGIPSRASTSTQDDDGTLDIERHAHTLEWGLAFEYSIPYLNANVRGTGWSDVANRFIPVVELAMSTALDRGSSGTTGTVNPGLLWDGRYVQLAVEAAIPVNRASGSYVGWTLQLHFFLDDLFPKAFGHPLIGS
ncbi:MAG: hypothetical protein ACREX6_07385 [Casimicrobiaceae bacterium]